MLGLNLGVTAFVVFLAPQEWKLLAPLGLFIAALITGRFWTLDQNIKRMGGYPNADGTWPEDIEIPKKAPLTSAPENKRVK